MGFTALLILWKQPFALYDAGFQLSFIAVLGVVWAGKIVQSAYQRHAVLQKIGTGFVLQLVILPVTAWYFYEIPVYAMLLNLLVLPFVELYWCRNCRGSAGVCGDARAVLVHIVLLPCHVILSGYEKNLYDRIGSASCVADYRKPSAVKITVYYLLLAVGLFCFLM